MLLNSICYFIFYIISSQNFGKIFTYIYPGLFWSPVAWHSPLKLQTSKLQLFKASFLGEISKAMLNPNTSVTWKTRRILRHKIALYLVSKERSNSYIYASKNTMCVIIIQGSTNNFLADAFKKKIPSWKKKYLL